jgi:phosphatidylserine/phosphatidylglycerophosphate/cardiolipin synthase-like enzyme
MEILNTKNSESFKGSRMIKSIQRLALVGVFFSVLAGFGIVAYVIRQSQDTQAKILASLVGKDGHVAKAFFSPDDAIKPLLIGLIEAERKRILVAIYTFTEKDIAQALVDAHDRGVSIEVVADRSYGSDRYSKIPLLANSHIPVWIYQSDVDERKSSLLHHKFCIFEDTVDHKALLWTGSYNFTQRATLRNQENVVVLDNVNMIEQFKQQFEKLKARSLLISGQPGKVYSTERPVIDKSLLYTIKQWLRKINVPI